ncbi:MULTISPECIES: FimV/HubP family polar landmark protein [unclassified Halorhodospira]|uniref:FimV/HubP family polar landmark protein n=1 Tax=unclassified Halorhodospira TaxID=2626748 RepID=UPI001EE7EE32|nr:hypothetical protein [Halorhodospira sp. M39old]MCG5545312.1 hypothetical protein [Halorhodospira sp. M38]
MRKAIHGLAGLAGLSLVSVAAAVEVSLGTIEGRSEAGEPVSARIPVRDLGSDELARLDVGLAPGRIFDRAGIERAPELSLLDFELIESGEDAPYIAVTSQQPIDEPLLDFLVQVSWPEGDLVREYTLLLERPTTADDDAPAQGQPLAREGEPFEEVTRDGERERRSTAYGPVEEGDTLWRIASEHRPDDSVTVAQTMLAIQRLNPRAFSDDNVNDLLSGWWLKLPSREQIEQLSAGEAQAIYEEHLASWVPPAERRAAVEELDESVPIPDLADPDAPVGEEEAPTAEEARLRILALGDEEGTEEVLSLLDTELEASEANVRRLQGALAALREERASLRSERDSLRAQVEDLSERVAALERLVDLDMEGVLPPPDAEPTPIVPLPEVDEPLDPLDEPEPAPVEVEPEAPEREEETEDEVGWAQWLSGDGDVTAADLWRDEEARRQMLIATGGTLLALAVVAGLLLRRRRRSAEPDSREGLRLDRGDLDFDFDSGARRDALELADEYLADDDLRRARDVLERGIHREPARTDLRLRLLEVHSRLGDREAFLSQAQDLYDRTRSDADPTWQAAVALGVAFVPDSPLFADAAAASQAHADEAEGEAQAPGGAAADGGTPESPAPEVEEGLDTKPDLEDLDLGLDADEGEGVGKQAPGEGEGEDDFDRRLDAAFDEQPQPAEPEAAGGPAAAEPAEGPEPAMAREPESSAGAQDVADELFGGADASGDELDEMDLDSLFSEEEDEGAEEGLGLQADEGAEPEAEPEPSLGVGEGDEADTKLDLARAYIDLGDEPGARSLLEEVLEEGTESQRESARQVLAELGGE